jgi:hypothetical protein
MRLPISRVVLCDEAMATRTDSGLLVVIGAKVSMVDAEVCVLVWSEYSWYVCVHVKFWR